MTGVRPPERAASPDHSGLDHWYRLFRTIIAGAIVAVIAWFVLQPFLHTIILLIASFLVAYILGPLVVHVERVGLPRLAAIILVYLAIVGGLAIGGYFLLTPLTDQLRSLSDTLKNLQDTQTSLGAFLQAHGIKVNAADVRNQLSNIGSAGGSVIDGTLNVIQGIVRTVTDILLILVVTFYFLLDGRAMHDRAVRLLPAAYQGRWFFFEATLNLVLGGYIRGQFIVAATVGTAAGLGCYIIGVHYAIVIGLLAFLFELIPMIGPVLGAIPAIAISLFQPHTPVVWVIVYFVVLQQIESNLIVPRVSGHAVGLHPLAALLALLAGLDLAGIGGALLAVPLVGVLYVLTMALYSDATGRSRMLVARPRSYDVLARYVGWRRKGGGHLLSSRTHRQPTMCSWTSTIASSPSSRRGCAWSRSLWRARRRKPTPRGPRRTNRGTSARYRMARKCPMSNREECDQHAEGDAGWHHAPIFREP